MHKTLRFLSDAPLTPDPEATRIALDFVTRHRLAAMFGGSAPPDTALIATDLDWRHTTGSGATTVEAPALRILLCVTGRLDVAELDA